MKKALLALAVSATFISCGAHATGTHDDWTNPFDHATRTELNGAVKTLNSADAKETAARIEGDKNLQGQINGANGSIKAMDDKLNGAIGAGQTAYNQVQGQVGQLNDKIDGAVATQTGINAAQQDNNFQQQNQINAVQGAAQTANDRATNLEGRADKVEGAVRETNAQLAVTDARSINNAVRLDGVESGVAGNTAAIKATNSVVASQGATISQHTTQISNLDQRTTVNTTNIAKNTSDIKATNVTVNQHTTQLANHETRITGTEAALQKNAAQWQTQGQINNEYGQRLDAQDAMSSRFAGDLGNLKSQVAGMNDRINSADRKAEKALNAAAGALSVASIQFNTDVEAGFQVGAGVATLAGKNAAAVGVGGAVNKNWFVSGYATQAGSASGGAVSATYSFGR